MMNTRAVVKTTRYAPLPTLLTLGLALSVAAPCGATTTTETPGATVDAAAVRAAALTFLQRQEFAGGDAEVTVAELDARLRLAPCNQPLAAHWAPGSRKIGAVTVAVRCTTSGGWSVMVQGSVRVRLSVVTAARAVLPGTVLGKDDVTVAAMDITDRTNQFLTKTDDALGKRVARALAPGEMVNPSALTNPVLVRRGAEVIVRARTGELEIQASGKALSDGAVGQRVRVQNVTSLRIVEGWVMADGSVSISM